MPFFTLQRQLRKVKRYDTLTHGQMAENSHTEIDEFQPARRYNSDSESEARILSQEAVDEQIKSYSAPLTKQLEGLTQGMSDAHQVIFLPSASTSASSGTTGTSYTRGKEFPTEAVANFDQYHLKTLNLFYPLSSQGYGSQLVYSNIVNTTI